MYFFEYCLENTFLSEVFFLKMTKDLRKYKYTRSGQEISDLNK